MPQPHPAAAVDDDLAQHAVAQVRREHLAVRMVGRQTGERQPAAAQPEQVAALAQSDHGVDKQPRRQPNTEQRQWPFAPQPTWPSAGVRRHIRAGQVVDDLPLGAGLTDRRDDGFGGLAERRGLQRLERQRKVVALVHRRGGQHVVAVREGLVDVQIDADHQLQSAQSRLQFVAVGHRQHRVARADEQRPDLTAPGCGDLLGHHARRVRSSTDGKPPIRDRLRV